MRIILSLLFLFLLLTTYIYTYPKKEVQTFEPYAQIDNSGNFTSLKAEDAVSGNEDYGVAGVNDIGVMSLGVKNTNTCKQCLGSTCIDFRCPGTVGHPIAFMDAQRKVIYQDVDKILENLSVYITDCCFDAECKNKGKCGIFKPIKYGDTTYKDELGREYFRVYRGDYVGLENRYE